MISSTDSALGLLSTRSFKHVVFIWKDSNSQSMKAVATKVDRSIGAYPVPLIRRAISTIFFPKVAMSFPGSSVSLVFFKYWTSA